MRDLVELLLFYTLERALFNRMVIWLSMNPQLVKMAIAFWLVLEEISGYHHLIHLTRIIYSFDNSAIGAIFQETLSCLHHFCVQPNAVISTKPPHVGSSSSYDGGDAPPLLVFSAILGQPITPPPRFLYYNRDFFYRRFVHVMATVCDQIFGENAAIQVVFDGTLFAPGGAAFSSIDAATTLLRGKTRRPSSSFNPNATEFFPGRPLLTSVDDTHTMFLTFSRGFPLTPQEIFNFFTTKWGDVVEDVMVEKAGGVRAALYGVATLKSDTLIPLILNGQSKAKFFVNGKHLWARLYVATRRPRP